MKFNYITTVFITVVTITVLQDGLVKTWYIILNIKTQLSVPIP
nr:hypothetical protein [Candidatus Megaera polyxenophila]